MILSLFLFARCLGLFVASPLFSYLPVGKLTRLSLAFVFSLLIAPPLLNQEALAINLSSPLFVLRLLQELSIGYLLGFLFSLLIEAAAFAGQVVGTLCGFSATELLDPLATTSSPLISRLFALIGFTLLLALDLHHVLLRLVYESFLAIPINFYPFNSQVALGMIGASGRLFHHALAYAIFPLLMLILLIILFAIMARYLPIFWIGFPIQLLIGFGAIALATCFFAPVLEQSFYELVALTKKILFPL